MGIQFLFKKRPRLGENNTGRDSLQRPYYLPLTNFGGTGEVPQRVWQVRAPSQMIFGDPGQGITDLQYGGYGYLQLASTPLANTTNNVVAPPPITNFGPGTFGSQGFLG